MGDRPEVAFMKDAVVLPGAQLPMRFTDDQIRVMRMAIERIGNAPIAVTLNVDATGVDHTFCLVFPDVEARGMRLIVRSLSACEQMAGELRSMLQDVREFLVEAASQSPEETS